MDDEDMNFIWDTIQQQQLIFHPYIAPYGKFDFKKFFEVKRDKSIVLFVDRNILSGLLKFCERGSLLDKGESQILGLLMTWAQMNNIAISAGPAVQEYATQSQNQEVGLMELQKFFEIIDTYPGQMWLRIAEGQQTEIVPVIFSKTLAQNITVNYSNGGDHYYMMVASMLHMVSLYRKRGMKPIDKMIEFLRWTYDNLLVSQYAVVYAALLFTGQDSIKAPKGANTNSIERIVAGCENQAWDLAYLSNWSTLYWNPENYNEEFMFATNDILLKRIFINTHGPNGVNGLLFEVFSQKEYDKLCDFMEERTENRVKPDFGTEPQVYLGKLIEKEKAELMKVLNIDL
ncbi:MAG: hypothetical protein IJZ23_04735 [Roseburia sp.]|nr:hypothetical protein [Roseburia sp.]